MKSGDAKRLEKMFEDHHSDEDCNGKWETYFQENLPYRLDIHIILTLTHAPFVRCNKCNATFFAPGFEDWLKSRVAKDLINQQGMLPKPVIRFLRTLTGKTQREIAAYLDLSQEEYNKFESVSNRTRQLNPDRQARLKAIFADLLDIRDVAVYRRVGYIQDKEIVTVPKTLDGHDFKMAAI